ncbi:MAG: hypothetical protein K2O56_04075, partial [Muribaculaceae bacterium]|nr:hypothetical protein [Muribaculaceae bacterium]
MENNDLRERAASENELLDILSKGEGDAAAFPYENYIIIGDSGEIDKIINTGGLINIEVEDITSTLSETSVNYVTTGYAEGTNRFSDAFKNALEKLPVAVDRISNLLINIWMPKGVQPSLKERDSIP